MLNVGISVSVLCPEWHGGALRVLATRDLLGFQCREGYCSLLDLACHIEDARCNGLGAWLDCVRQLNFPPIPDELEVTADVTALFASILDRQSLTGGRHPEGLVVELRAEFRSRSVSPLLCNLELNGVHWLAQRRTIRR